MTPSENNKDLENKKWNSEQDKSKSQPNEGFSGKNLPDDYNPSKGKLKTEVEKDQDGNADVVKRARDVDNYDSEETISGEDLKSKKNPENRDKNSDTDPDRYPSGHPENKKDRGNINLDDDK